MFTEQDQLDEIAKEEEAGTFAPGSPGISMGRIWSDIQEIDDDMKRKFVDYAYAMPDTQPAQPPAPVVVVDDTLDSIDNGRSAAELAHELMLIVDKDHNRIIKLDEYTTLIEAFGDLGFVTPEEVDEELA